MRRSTVIRPRVHHLLAILALSAPACDSTPAEPPSEFPFASASLECGPADGPAVTISLTKDTMPELPPGSPHVRIYLWRGLNNLVGKSWDVGGASEDGAAEYWDGTGDRTPLRGAVRVTGVGADSTVEGDVSLASDGTFTVRGGFRARWIPRTLLCG